MRKLLLFKAFLLSTVFCASALDGLHYSTEAQPSFSSGENTPFWLVSNHYGLSSVKKNNGYFRAGVFRSIDADSASHWGWGAGVDLAAAYNYSSSFIIQQLYGEVRYRKFTLSIGSKEREPFMLDRRLSSGDLLFSTNARPIPEVRLETPDYIVIPGLGGWLGLKGYISYGMFTDDRWQRDWAAPGSKRSEDVLFHSKGGFARVGNLDKFPVQLEVGFEMAAQFGGRSIAGERIIRMPSSLKDFIRVFVPSGGDSSTPAGEQSNIYGNHLGQWSARLEWHAPGGWRPAVYYEHYFEDHSMMFLDFAWKDCLVGLELGLPENPFVSKVVYEYLGTKDQSGPVYWDHTPEIPEQVSGRDNYYNHGIYTGWQHWGMGIGNPLVISPIYNASHIINFRANRLIGHHIGLEGQPLPCLGYRGLFSYSRTWGTYGSPLPEVQRNINAMLELTLRLERFKGWSLSGAVAADMGGLLGRSWGGMVTLRKTGIL